MAETEDLDVTASGEPGGGGASGSARGAVPAYDLDEMIRTATTLPGAGIDVAGLKSGLTDAARRKVAAGEGVRQKTSAEIESDRQRIHQKYDEIGPLDVQPWDAQRERERNSTPPLEAFGSFATVFAIAASAFTRQPMVNALNGAAAAMNAIHAGDEKAYERAFDAWKQNSQLAIKKHEVQRQSYMDAIKLLETDATAGNAQLRMVASQYEDTAMLALIEAGAIPQIMELEKSRQQAALGIVQAMPKIEKEAAQREILRLDPDFNSEDPVRKQMALRRYAEGRYSPEQQLLDQFIAENPDASASERAEFITKLRRGQTPQQAALQRFLEDNPDAKPEAIADFLKSMAKPGYRSTTLSGQRAAAVDELMAQREREGRPISRADAIKEVERKDPQLSGNRADDIRKTVQALDNSMDKIDASLGVLEKYVGAAGLAGRARRGIERVGNIFGSNHTDLDQFMRDIQYLRSMAGRLLLDTQGRPLSAEAQRINDIVGGLSAGDTTANTIRSLQEIKRLYQQMRANAAQRLDPKSFDPSQKYGGAVSSTPSAPTAAPSAASPDKKPAWMDAPEVQ